MTNTINILKNLGNLLRSSNPSHQASLRETLSARVRVETTRKASTPIKSFIFFGSLALTVLVLFVITRPHNSPSVLTYQATAPDFDITASSDDTSSALGVAREPTNTGFIDYSADYSALKVFNNKVADDEVVDYTRQHGQMLDTSTGISILTTKPDLSTQTNDLFNAFGGHVSEIDSSGTKHQTITGLVPTDSYFLFKEQMRDLTNADRYFSEVLNARDLVPSAVTVDKQIEEATISIDALQKQINETKDDATRNSLKNQLTNLESRREDLHKSRQSLDDQASYTSVSVYITQIPGFWQSRTPQDFRQLVAGLETPSVFQNMWINTLIITSLLLQLLSLTFWLIIPLSIWFVMRERTRREWKRLE